MHSDAKFFVIRLQPHQDLKNSILEFARIHIKLKPEQLLLVSEALSSTACDLPIKLKKIIGKIFLK
jgi:hypothetical protein